MHMPTKKYKRKKGLQIMFNGSNCDRKSQLSEILTEPLNPHAMQAHFLTVLLKPLTVYRVERSLCFQTFKSKYDFLPLVHCYS